jgi:hypothetical protein
VGIGVTNPTDTLSYGRALDIQSSTGGAIYLRDSDAVSVYGLFAYDGGATNRTSIGGIGTDNYVRIISAGNEAMRITSVGNVGIGATSPAAKLHIKNTVAEPTGIIIENTNNAQNLNIDFWNNVGAVQARINYAEGAGDFNFYPNTGAGEALTLKYGGNVGIGSISPAYKLDVAGDIQARASDPLVILQPTSGTSAFLQKLSTSNGNFLRLYDGTDYSMFWIGGNVGIGLTNPSYKLDVNGQTRSTAFYAVNDRNQFARGFIRLTSATNNTSTLDISVEDTITSIYSNYFGGGADQPIRIGTYANLANQLYLATSGNVGIGTATPLFKLDVNGTLNWKQDTLLTSGGYKVAYRSSVNNFLYTGTSGLSINNDADNVSLVYIQNGGNVGINTAGPSYRLDVKSAGGQTTPTMRIWNTNQSWEAEATIRAFADAYSTSYTAVDFGLHRGYGNEASSGFIVKTGTDASTSIKLFIRQDGAVGIGTTNPVNKLHVVGPVNIERIGVPGVYSTIDMEGNFRFNASSGYAHAFLNNGSELVRIQPSGNVGISTGTPVEKLDVVGRVKITQSGYGWIYGNDINHSIILRGNRDGTAQDYTNYYQFGGTLAAGKGHLFWTEGVLASQRLKFQIADDGIYSTVNVGIGTIAPQSNLDIYTTYSSSNKSLIARNGAGTINTQTYDTVIIQQADVTTLRMVERNVGGTDQLMTLSIGDGYGRIATTAQPLQFFVNGSTTGLGYQGLGGTLAMTIATNGNIGIGTDSPSATLHVDSGATGATAYALRTDAASLDYALYVSSSGNVAVGGLVPAAQLNHKFVVFSGSIALRGPNDPNFSYRLNDTAGTNRNALYVSSSNYLNVGNAAFAGIELFHTGSAPDRKDGDPGGINGYYGSDGATYLAEPNKWLAVRVAGTNYVIPMYE